MAGMLSVELQRSFRARDDKTPLLLARTLALGVTWLPYRGGLWLTRCGVPAGVRVGDDRVRVLYDRTCSEYSLQASMPCHSPSNIGA
jgi:hypothetical protein